MICLETEPWQSREQIWVTFVDSIHCCCIWYETLTAINSRLLRLKWDTKRHFIWDMRYSNEILRDVSYSLHIPTRSICIYEFEFTLSILYLWTTWCWVTYKKTTDSTPWSKTSLWFENHDWRKFTNHIVRWPTQWLMLTIVSAPAQYFIVLLFFLLIHYFIWYISFQNCAFQKPSSTS